MRNSFTIGLLLFTVLFANAQITLIPPDFREGSIIFKDGKVLKGLVRHPAKYNTSEIAFKENEEAKVQKISSDDLRTVIIKGESRDFEFDRGTYNQHLTFRGNVESKPHWMVVITRGPVTLYTVPMKVKIKGDDLEVINEGVITYYCKRESEKIAKDIAARMSGITAGLDKDFRQRASEYFSDYPALVTKINNENLGVGDLLSVVEEYNKWAASRKKK